MSRSHFPRRPDVDARRLARDLWRRGLATVRSTPGLLLLSLLMAITLWVFVTEEENPTLVDVFPTKIRVEAVNVGQSLAVANVLPSVEVRIAAPADTWEQLTAVNFRAIVDLSGLEGREQQVSVRIEVDGVRGVRVLEALPPVIIVNLEDFVTREVPVGTRLIGTLPRGYELEQATPDRLSVEIAGPESLVALVHNVIADVNVTGLTVGIEQSVQLVPRSEGGGEVVGVFIDPPAIVVDVVVRQSTLRRTVALEVEVSGQPAVGYRITGIVVQPATVMLEGTFERLQELATLSLGRVTVDGARQSLQVTLPVVVPEGVRAASEVSVLVIVSIEAAFGSTVLILAPEFVNVPSGLNVSLGEASRQITVVLEGTLPDLNALTTGDVRAIVDASGLGDVSETTTVTLPLSIEVPPGIEVADVRPQVVSATVEVQ